MICTVLVSYFPHFTGVHGLDFREMLHLQKLTHQHRTFEILIPTTQAGT